MNASSSAVWPLASSAATRKATLPRSSSTGWLAEVTPPSGAGADDEDPQATTTEAARDEASARVDMASQDG
ncbi:MAG: hypothetical protein IPJ34_30100 [Myxococcales bacterium]|nr:hypothetical protein [Myxococcales bacterium]